MSAANALSSPALRDWRRRWSLVISLHLHGLDAQVVQPSENALERRLAVRAAQNRLARAALEGHVAEGGPEPLAKPAPDDDPIALRLHGTEALTARGEPASPVGDFTPGDSGGALHQPRRHHRHDQRSAVEELLDEALNAEQLQPRDPGDQEVDGDQRAPGVEAARGDAGRAEERARVRGKQEVAARRWVGAAVGARVEHAGEARDDRPRDQRAKARPRHPDAAQAGDAAPPAGEQQPPPQRSEVEHVPERDAEHEPVPEGEW